ncbi:hypothetical protein NPIL_380011 [Nephila pilipes]|uniref:Uncharacterized protein n=1 Tax=Nephila pilipes TaxID=299642 RepID=A0A8X6MRG8_NEPPI|nr:hypothetical protein NPIL_380011 [Nephila pilipes]
MQRICALSLLPRGSYRFRCSNWLKLKSYGVDRLISVQWTLEQDSYNQRTGIRRGADDYFSDVSPRPEKLFQPRYGRLLKCRV